MIEKIAATLMAVLATGVTYEAVDLPELVEHAERVVAQTNQSTIGRINQMVGAVGGTLDYSSPEAWVASAMQWGFISETTDVAAFASHIRENGLDWTADAPGKRPNPFLRQK